MSKIKLGKTGVEVIKEWVIKTFLKQQPKGVLTTLPKKDFVELNTGITAERLMRNGVDPNSIKNVDQVENIINQLNKPRAVAADSPKGKGITEALFGKKGEVFNIQGEKLDPSKPIVGGTQQGKKINREFFSRDAEGKDDIKKGIAKEVQKRIDSGVATTVEKMLAMEPIDAMKEANLVIGRKGPYKNLTQEDAKKILQDTEDHIFERNVDIDPEDMFADGGRIGFKGGADMATVSGDTRAATAKSANVSATGNVTTSRDKGPDPVDDRGSSDQNMVQMLVRQGYTPKEIRSITNPSAIDKIKNSPINNPLTRSILRTGLYTLNPSLGAIDFRKAMQLKNLYDYTKDQINEPVTEEDLTLGLITDKQKQIIDKQGKIGQLTGAFDPDQTFKAAKTFDDKGGFFSDAEPMTREEFDAYVEEKGFSKGGRIGLKKGMDRRTFMKIMGGLTTIPVFGKFFKGAEVASTVAPKVMENFSSKASEAPAYFFDLITKIKMFGKKSKVGPSERVDEYSYRGKNGDEYTLTEDITTGDAQITKDKMGIGTSGDKSFDVINDRSVMEYKAPKTDVDVETQRPINEGAEYEEYKIEFDQDGTQAGADAIDEMIQKEIIEEAAEEAPSIKKASGGIARMLGE